MFKIITYLIAMRNLINLEHLAYVQYQSTYMLHEDDDITVNECLGRKRERRSITGAIVQSA